MKHDLKLGDEVYMLDCIFRRCEVVNGFDGDLSLLPLDEECDNIQYRAIASYDKAIELMRDKLDELKNDA